MTGTLSIRAFALFAAALILAPAAFTAATPPARAVDNVNVLNILKDSATAIADLVQDTISAVKASASYLLDVTNTAANIAKKVKSYILDPIAFLVSGDLLKKITSSILGFVGGKNGTGKPLYIQNLRSYLQNVGDVEAYSFLNQFQKQSNSPFAGAITSSLRANYLQSTTLTGFFAANKSTLSRVSSNPQAFVAGDWSKGGLAAWFGLTTEDQNNPYIYYHIARDQMYRQVQTAEAAKLAQANWGQGFLSWCGSGSGLGTSGSGGTGGDYGGGCDNPDENGVCPGDSSTRDDTFSSSVVCSGGTVEAGSICGCQSLDGCTDPQGNLVESGNYVLPVGYSCGGGASFNSTYGGCEAQGLYSPPVDSSGVPLLGPGATGDTGGSINGNVTPAAGSGNTAQILTSHIYAIKKDKATSYNTYMDWNGNPTSGGRCWEWTRSAFQADGYNLPPGGQGSVGILRNGGFTAVATDISESQLTQYVQDNCPVGCAVGVAKGSRSNGYGYDDVQLGYVEGGTVKYAADYIRGTRSNPYAGQPPVVYTVWKPPARTSLDPQSRSALTASVYLAQAELLGDFDSSSDTSSASSFPPDDGFGGTPSSSASPSNASPSATSGGSTLASSGGSLVRPGDPCTKPDGTEGKIQTPGSIIKDYLSRALGSSIGKLEGVGDIAADIGGIMKNISTIMSTVDLATSLFGGGGLTSFSGTGSYTSPFQSYLNDSTYLGLTTTDAATYSSGTDTSSTDLASRASDYEAAWTTIDNAADAAASSLNSLSSSCSAQSSVALSTLTTYVKPVQDEATAAEATVADARALVDRIATELTTDSAAYAADIVLAVTQPPSTSDVTTTQNEASAPGFAVASPVGSLTVGGTGSTKVDRMYLIKVNADAIKNDTTLCPPPPLDCPLGEHQEGTQCVADTASDSGPSDSGGGE